MCLCIRVLPLNPGVTQLRWGQCWMGDWEQMLGFGCGCVVGWAESEGSARSRVLQAVRVPGVQT
jgi:hypothetical protein